MIKKLVVRDASGAVINIGPWDLQEAELTDNLPEGFTAEDEPQGDGSYRMVWRNPAREIIPPIKVAMNPIPPGATVAEENVVEGWDGGLYVKGDPRAIRV